MPSALRVCPLDGSRRKAASCLAGLDSSPPPPGGWGGVRLHKGNVDDLGPLKNKSCWLALNPLPPPSPGGGGVLNTHKRKASFMTQMTTAGTRVRVNVKSVSTHENDTRSIWRLWA